MEGDRTSTVNQISDTRIFSDKLKDWALKYQVSVEHLDELMEILRKSRKFQKLLTMDAATLLQDSSCNNDNAK